MSKKINILHVVGGSSEGGAAKGATNLHNAMIRFGMNSFIIYGFHKSKKDNVDKNIINKSYFINYLQSRILIFFDRMILKFYVNRKKYIFSSGLFGINLNSVIKKNKIDILNLHWVNHGMLNINSIKLIQIPIVWTIRDAWVFTGGCHFLSECNNYQFGCGKCPQLKSSKENDLSRYIFKIKKKNISKVKKIKFVAISNFMKQKAIKSPLIKNEVDVIPNIVNFKDFQSYDKIISRKKLGLDTKSKTILFQNNSGEEWKGTNTIDEIKKNLSNDFQLISFGNGEGYKNIKNFGYINNYKDLSLIYSSTDIFVFLSEQEPFGKVLFEAAWCGAKVACFKNGGTFEYYNNEDWWTVFESSDPKKMANQISSALKTDHCKLHEVHRQLALKLDDKLVVDAYQKIYNKLLN